jgi:glutamyl-tRNA reductase
VRTPIGCDPEEANALTARETAKSRWERADIRGQRWASFMHNGVADLRCLYYDHLALGPARTAELAARAKKYLAASAPNDAMRLITCLRVEFYHRERTTPDTLIPLLEQPERHQVIQGAAVFQRLIEIGCGVRSQILGERFILTQLGSAFARISADETLRSLGAIVMEVAASLRRRHQFFSPLDYEGVVHRLLKARLRETDGRSPGFVIVGGGFLAQAIARWMTRHVHTIVIITRSPKRLRRTFGSNTSFAIHRIGAVPIQIINRPFNLFIATDNIDKDYETKIFQLMNRAECEDIIDMSSCPIIRHHEHALEGYVSMYSDEFLAEVQQVNEMMAPKLPDLVAQIATIAKNALEERRLSAEALLGT